jgi:hypothetical protein
MPHVLDDTDIQEYSSPASEYYDLHERARALQSFRRGCVALLASLRSMRLSLRRSHSTPAQAHLCRTPQEPETSMDALARKYPDIYMRLTTWAS